MFETNIRALERTVRKVNTPKLLASARLSEHGVTIEMACPESGKRLDRIVSWSEIAQIRFPAVFIRIVYDMKRKIT